MQENESRSIQSMSAHIQTMKTRGDVIEPGETIGVAMLADSSSQHRQEKNTRTTGGIKTLGREKISAVKLSGVLNHVVSHVGRSVENSALSLRSPG